MKLDGLRRRAHQRAAYHRGWDSRPECRARLPPACSDNSQPADGAWIKHCHFERRDARHQLHPVALADECPHSDGPGSQWTHGRGLDGGWEARTSPRSSWRWQEVAWGRPKSCTPPTPSSHRGRPLGTPLPGIRACVYNAENVLQVGFAAALTIALQTNPSGATLVGTLTQVPVSGCATWNNLTVDMAGLGIPCASRRQA